MVKSVCSLQHLSQRLSVTHITGQCEMTAPNVCKDEASGEIKKKKKKEDRSKFHTPKYIKVTPVSIASKQKIRNCSFLQLSRTLEEVSVETDE